MISKLKVTTNHRVPVIREVDLLVIDGGLAGMEIARRISKEGKTVMLVESQTYLGGIPTKAQRSWLSLSDCEDKLVKTWFPPEAGNAPGIFLKPPRLCGFPLLRPHRKAASC